MTKSIIELAAKACKIADEETDVNENMDWYERRDMAFAALHRAAILEELTGEMPEQCNVALISNFQGQGEYRNLSWEYCDTTAKYSEKQMREFAAGLVAKAVAAERERIADQLENVFTGYTLDQMLEYAAGLVAKAVAAEREQCALAVEAIEKHCIELDCDDPALFNVAAAIRARGDV